MQKKEEALFLGICIWICMYTLVYVCYFLVAAQKLRFLFSLLYTSSFPFVLVFVLPIAPSCRFITVYCTLYYRPIVKVVTQLSASGRWLYAFGAQQPSLCDRAAWQCDSGSTWLMHTFLIMNADFNKIKWSSWTPHLNHIFTCIYLSLTISFTSFWFNFTCLMRTIYVHIY